MLRDKLANFATLDLPVSALYLLAAPSTPEAARDAVLGLGKRQPSVDNALRFSLNAHFESAAWYFASIRRCWRSCGLWPGRGFAYAAASFACCRGVINIPPFNVSSGDVLIVALRVISSGQGPSLL
jgi:hypothetical protein